MEHSRLQAAFPVVNNPLTGLKSIRQYYCGINQLCFGLGANKGILSLFLLFSSPNAPAAKPSTYMRVLRRLFRPGKISPQGCPYCGSIDTRRSSRKGLHERVLLQMLLHAPYRCTGCKSRFVSWSPGPDSLREGYLDLAHILEFWAIIIMMWLTIVLLILFVVSCFTK